MESFLDCKHAVQGGQAQIGEVLLVEIAEVTPPVGFNLFVLQNMTGKDSHTIARAAIPFFLCLVVCIALITLFPAIVTWLPDVVMGVEK